MILTYFHSDLKFNAETDSYYKFFKYVPLRNYVKLQDFKLHTVLAMMPLFFLFQQILNIRINSEVADTSFINKIYNTMLIFKHWWKLNNFIIYSFSDWIVRLLKLIRRIRQTDRDIMSQMILS